MDIEGLSVDRGLIVRPPWARALVDGTKKWELRNRPTQVRETVAVLEGGSKLALGCVDIADCIGPLGPEDLRKALRMGLILPDEVHDADTVAQYAWVVENPRPLPEPVSYHHPRGAVVWVDMKPSTSPTRSARGPRR